MVVSHCYIHRGMIVVFAEILILVSHGTKILFLKFPAAHKALDETCQLPLSQILSRVVVFKKYTQY